MEGLAGIRKDVQGPCLKEELSLPEGVARFRGASHFPEQMQSGGPPRKELAPSQEWLRIEVTMKALIPLLAFPSVLSEFTSSSPLPLGLSLQASVGWETVAFWVSNFLT